MSIVKVKIKYLPVTIKIKYVKCTLGVYTYNDKKLKNTRPEVVYYFII